MARYNLIYKCVVTGNLIRFRRIRIGFYERQDETVLSEYKMISLYDFVSQDRVKSTWVTNRNGFKVRSKMPHLID
jgi:hypothetical protein